MSALPVTPHPTPLPADQREAVLADPGFGRTFTDHMVTAHYDAERGWHDAAVVPYGPLALDPAAMALHYGQSIFEGLKAYRRADGSVTLFRPEQNAARFARSAQRLAMPPLPTQLFLDALTALVGVDEAWVPTGAERSLYLRPFMFATEVGLGVRPSATYLFVLIASPAGAYFPRGVAPVTVWLSEDFTRAAPGGTGEAKCAGNYAASLVAQAEATRQGCDQVVWLDAAHHEVVEEMGGMNLVFVYGPPDRPRLVTPALTGTLLPGVTRDSLLTLARDLGMTAQEGTVTVPAWRADAASGELTEVFACGTAAVVTPVGAVRSRAGDWVVGDGTPGPVTLWLRRELLAIQTGQAADPYGWTVPVGA